MHASPVVGYLGKTFAAPAAGQPSAYYMCSPMFEGIALEGVDIQSIVPSSATTTIAADQISLFVINKDRVTVGTYNYRTEAKNPKTGKVTRQAGWYDAASSATTPCTKVFGAGEGFQVECQYEITLTFSGQVKAVSPSFTASLAGYYRIGNMTPTAIDIQKIIPTSTETIAADQISLYTYKTDRSIDGTYNYRTEAKNPKTGKVTRQAGWYDAASSATTPCTKSFGPGDGFVLETAYANTTLTFPDPLAKEEAE